MTKTATAPRIYVASLSDYNNGILHGEWIDAAQDADDIRTEISTMLRGSKFPNVTVDCPECDGNGERDIIGGVEPCWHCKGTGKTPSAEEWAIHDFEGFGNWKMSESESIDAVAAYANAIDQLDEDDATAFSAWFDNSDANMDDDADTMIEKFREVYQGCFDSLGDYAADWIEQTGGLPKDLPDYIRNHINYDGIGRDFELGGDIWTHEEGGQVYVFDNH